MSANGLKFGLSPKRLQIEEMRLLEPGAKVMIFKDRSVNLTKMLKRPDAPTTETKPQPAKPPAPAVASPKNRTLFPMNIHRIRVEKGIVDFADLSLILPFATQITDFKGNIMNISSEPASRASVNFNGRVDEYGFATVEGRLSAFTPKRFTDISVLFRNVEMKPFTPYSATFAGRKIASGKLNLNLEYKIQNSELLGENEVLLEQFTLGERVEAPNATNLPLDLAIALLTDAEGKIDVAVPVRGNVDHPEFKYGRMIWQSLVKLITKAVTSPFRALGDLFGDKSQQMDAIAFNPGSARLLPPEQEKLTAVSIALKKRPQLKLVVEGGFDTKEDGKALRTKCARRALAEQMGVKLAPGDDPGPIAVDSSKTQKALEKLLEIRSGDTAIADFKTRYEKATDKKAERANFAMALIGWASSDTAFYQAMFEELVKIEPLNDNDLKDLALSRTEAIVKELKMTHGLDETRVTAGKPGPAEKALTETVNTRLKLDVIKPSM
jgi:outer membrane protein OmpA-like peptidoglycan-associated protein